MTRESLEFPSTHAHAPQVVSKRRLDNRIPLEATAIADGATIVLPDLFQPVFLKELIVGESFRTLLMRVKLAEIYSHFTAS